MPIVSSTHCDIPSVVLHGRTGLLAGEHDVPGLLQHLRWLVANPGQWEPMVTAGRHAVRMGEDHWAIYSQDGSLAAHFEFTVAVTEDGPRILTPWHED